MVGTEEVRALRRVVNQTRVPGDSLETSMDSKVSMKTSQAMQGMMACSHCSV